MINSIKVDSRKSRSNPATSRNNLKLLSKNPSTFLTYNSTKEKKTPANINPQNLFNIISISFRTRKSDKNSFSRFANQRDTTEEEKKIITWTLMWMMMTKCFHSVVFFLEFFTEKKSERKRRDKSHPRHSPSSHLNCKLSWLSHSNSFSISSLDSGSLSTDIEWLMFQKIIPFFSR